MDKSFNLEMQYRQDQPDDSKKIVNFFTNFKIQVFSD